MTAGWVAGSVRARAMARRVLGTDQVRRVAACRSLAEAQGILAATPFRGAAVPGLSLAAAQHAVAGTILWDLRVLAGWLPRDGVSLLRLLAGWFEIANVDELLRALAGRSSGEEFQLGALATAWPRLSQAASLADLRQALAASAWGDPGGEDSRAIRLGLRVCWAARVTAYGGRAGRWAAEAAALLRPGQPEATARRPDQGGRHPGRHDLAVTRAPAAVSPPGDPWQGEPDWWRRAEAEGRMLLRSSGLDSDPVLGAVAVLAAEARRVSVALGVAARGGLGLEAYDALA